MPVTCKACGRDVVLHADVPGSPYQPCKLSRKQVYEAHIAALEAAIKDAPHGAMCAVVGGYEYPCDCWKSRALSGAPAEKSEDTNKWQQQCG